MQFRTWLPTVGALAMLLTSAAHAQVGRQGFFSPAGVAAFTPEVDVVASGVIQDVQAVVSADRKYVTMTMRPQSTNLIALRNFTFQNGSGLGFVGSGGPNGGGNAAGGAAAGNAAANANNAAAGRAAQAAPAPAAAPAKPSVLDKPGMTRLG